MSVSVYERDQSRSARVQGSALALHEDSSLAALKAAGLMDAFWPTTARTSIAFAVTNGTGIVLRGHPRQMSGAGKRPEIERGPLRDLLLDSLGCDEGVAESLKKYMLLFADERSCIVQAEPTAAIYFRDGDLLVGATWPYDAARVAYQERRIAVSFEGPGMSRLTALLSYIPKTEEGWCSKESSLFVELAHCSGK